MTEQPSLADSYDYWYRLGSEQIDNGEYEQALASFDRAVQYNADAHDAWYKKGNALFYLNGARGLPWNARVQRFV